MEFAGGYSSISEQPRDIEDCQEHDVEIIIPLTLNDNGEIISIYPSEIKKELNKQFYFASTRKVPFLDVEKVK